MKAALRGQVAFTLETPEALPAAAKQDFGDGIRYLWAKLPQPVRQDGEEFSYVVAPFKLTDETQFEQKGAGVLCQTEAEAKEAFENLERRRKSHLVAVQWPGAGLMGWMTDCRRLTTEIGVFHKTLPGGKKSWVAVERERDEDTLEVKVLRRKEADSEAEANSLADQWQAEYDKGKAAFCNASHQKVTPPPPARCTALTKSDIEDLGKAKMTALQKQWPRCFDIFERQKTNPACKIPDQEVEDAYLLDLVANGGERSLNSAKGGKVRADMQLISALHKAAQNYARRGKSKIIDVAVYLIGFKWELGWCYLSDEQLAQKLGEILETKFTPGQVKQYRSRTLGLVGKHLPGPSPNAP